MNYWCTTIAQVCNFCILFVMGLNKRLEKLYIAQWNYVHWTSVVSQHCVGIIRGHELGQLPRARKTPHEGGLFFIMNTVCFGDVVMETLVLSAIFGICGSRQTMKLLKW